MIRNINYNGFFVDQPIDIAEQTSGSTFYKH